jgi:NitT/TauT family transport system ATP-binding protein
VASAAPTGSLRIEDLGFTYVSPNGEAVVAVEQVDLDVEAGEFVCLLGPSGCGKSTLLFIVAGLLRPTRGKVFLDRTPLPEVGDLYGRISVIFQEYALFPWLSVRDNIEFPLRIRGWSGERRRIQVEKFMEMVNLGPWAAKKPSQLSGGMKQRVGIARALALDPELLLMDEPFAALDAQTRSLMQEELLNIWQREAKTVLFVTHSIPEAVYLADRIVVMTSHPGRVKAVVEVKDPRPRDVTSAAFNRVQREVMELLRPEIRRAGPETGAR